MASPPGAKESILLLTNSKGRNENPSSVDPKTTKKIIADKYILVSLDLNVI